MDLRCEVVAPPDVEPTDRETADPVGSLLEEEQTRIIVRNDTLQVRRDCGQQRGEIAGRDNVIGQFQKRAQVVALDLHRRVGAAVGWFCWHHPE